MDATGGGRELTDMDVTGGGQELTDADATGEWWEMTWMSLDGWEPSFCSCLGLQAQPSCFSFSHMSSKGKWLLEIRWHFSLKFKYSPKFCIYCLWALQEYLGPTSTLIHTILQLTPNPSFLRGLPSLQDSYKDQWRCFSTPFRFIFF